MALPYCRNLLYSFVALSEPRVPFASSSKPNLPSAITSEATTSSNATPNKTDSLGLLFLDLPTPLIIQSQYLDLHLFPIWCRLLKSCSSFLCILI